MAPTLRLFGLSFQTYPLLIIVGAWLTLWLTAREARRIGLAGDRIENLALYALLASVLGARIAYVLGHWAAYRTSPLAALSPTVTALSWPQGALIGLLVAILYGRRSRLPAGATLDALSPGMVLALAVERIGAFLSGRGLGLPAQLPWSVRTLDQLRHPVQIYEALALLLAFGVLWLRRSQRPFPGHQFVLSVALYSGVRLFLEAFRAQTPLAPGGLRIVQIAALAGTLGAVAYLYYRRFSPDRRPSVSSSDNVA